MIDKDTVKVLKFIADSQPCSFDDIERKFDADFRYSMQMRFIDIVGKLPDGKVLLSLTPEGKSAIEECGRVFNAERRANIALIIAFLALFKPASVDLFEFMKRLVL